MRIEERLKEILLDNVRLREVEPHILSLNQEDVPAYYDSFGGIYEVVACNRFYNRLVWGYWTSEFKALCASALDSSEGEWVFDAGCGSLAFTAGTYIEHRERPVVFLDQSMRMLRLAKSRIMKLNGTVPANMIFIQGDVSSLPFRDKSIGTVIAMNLLHAVEDAGVIVRELKRVESGSVSHTTLVKSGRLADKYIDRLGRMGAMVPRNLSEMLEVFADSGMKVDYLVKGNLAFVHHGRKIDYFRNA